MAQCQAQEDIRSKDGEREWERHGYTESNREEESWGSPRRLEKKGMAGKDSRRTKQAKWSEKKRKKTQDRKEIEENNKPEEKQDKWKTKGDRCCLKVPLSLHSLYHSSFFFIITLYHYHSSPVSQPAVMWMHRFKLTFALESTLWNMHARPPPPYENPKSPHVCLVFSGIRSQPVW